MTEPTWDDVKSWVKVQREEYLHRMRHQYVDMRAVDRANGVLDMLDMLERLGSLEEVPEQVPEAFVQ